MLVREMMTREVLTCEPTNTLNTAAELMWTNDIGCIPIVDREGRAVAMITDRDICMAAFTQGRRLVEMTVASAASDGVVTVRDNESVQAAEALMQEHKIRRIPVVDSQGRVMGMLSMNDLARRAQDKTLRAQGGLNPEDVLQTLAAVCAPNPRISKQPSV